MALHSSPLAWKIPWTEEPGRLQSMGSRSVRQDWATSLLLFTARHWRRKWQPLQCSCLENPRDGGAWWAAVFGVAQSRTRLKQLSSSSSSSRATKELLLVSSFPLFLRFLCSSGLISSHMIFWRGSGCSLDSCTSGETNCKKSFSLVGLSLFSAPQGVSQSVGLGKMPLPRKGPSFTPAESWIYLFKYVSLWLYQPLASCTSREPHTSLHFGSKMWIQGKLL